MSYNIRLKQIKIIVSKKEENHLSKKKKVSIFDSNFCIHLDVLNNRKFCLFNKNCNFLMVGRVLLRFMNESKISVYIGIWDYFYSQSS